MQTRTELWRYLEGLLDGRSWNWLGSHLAEPVTGAAVRGWASGKAPMPGFRADQIAAVLGVDANEIRAAAGLDPKEAGHGNAAPIVMTTDEAGRPVEATGPTVEHVLELVRQARAALDQIEREIDGD